MGIQIEDGTGTGSQVQVDLENRLYVSSVTTDQSTHASREHGNGYAWAASVNTVGAAYVLAVQNNSSSQNLYIETIRGCNDIASVWTIAFGTWSTVGGGTLVTGENLNNTSGRIADASAYSIATNLAVLGNPLAYSYAPIGAERTWRPDGKFILGYNDTIYLYNSVASTGFITAQIHGFFHD